MFSLSKLHILCLTLFCSALTFAQTGALVFIKSGDVWIMNTDGTNQTKLTNVGGVNFVRLSNSVLVYKTGNQLYRSTMQGFALSTPATAIPNASDVVEFDLHPDGSKLALTYYANYNSTLYTMNTDGSNRIALHSSNLHHFCLSWSRDGYIYFDQASVGNPFTQVMYRIPDSGSNNPTLIVNYFSQFPATGLPSGRVVFLYDYPVKKFRTMAPDGSGQQDVPGVDSGEGYYFSVDYYDDMIYYSNLGVISRVRPDGSGLQPLATGVYDFVDYGTIASDATAPVTTSITLNPNPIPVNAATTLTASFTDAGGSGLNTSYYTLDGSQPTFFAGLSGSSATANRNIAGFSTAGIRSFCARAQDNAGNLGAYECAPLVVYDPSGGFVTGGGWLQTISGRATIALLARYPHNASTPQGQFLFLSLANRFRSTDLSWLVITPNAATLRGIGEWNGSPGYTFEAVFTGGNADSVGLKVWNASGTVYNLPPTQLAGGQIIIH